MTIQCEEYNYTDDDLMDETECPNAATRVVVHQIEGFSHLGVVCPDHYGISSDEVGSWPVSEFLEMAVHIIDAEYPGTMDRINAQRLDKERNQ